MPSTNETIATKVIGSIEMNNQNHLILRDTSGFETFMPEALLRANGLIIKSDNHLNITPGLYERWFINEKQNKMNENAGILFRNFHTLYVNKQLIMNQEGYYKLGLRWLYAGGLYYGTLRYSLGSLLAEWETNSSLKKENGYMYKISGSMLSGSNIYETLNVEEGKLGNGNIKRAPGEHWTNYLQIFKKLSEQGMHSLSHNIKYSNELISKLNLT